MALTVPRLKREVEILEAKLEIAREAEAEITTREAQAELKIESAETEEELDALTREIDAIEADRIASDERIADIEEKLEAKREELRTMATGTPVEEKEKRDMIVDTDKLNRTIIEKYIRTKGRYRVDPVEGETGSGGTEASGSGGSEASASDTTVDIDKAFITDDGQLIIPTAISYQPTKAVWVQTDLSQYVTKTTVSVPSGTYPVMDHSDAKLHTVEELRKNPELAKPSFTTVSWTVDTYRGKMVISNEMIDDSAVDVMSLLLGYAVEQKINTTNDAIATVLKSFTAKTVTSVDDLKTLLNVTLLQPYARTFIMTQSCFDAIDKLKDEKGRYLIQPDIKEASQQRLLGYPLHIVEDKLFGAAGNMTFFLGDIGRGVFYADRKNFEVKWQEEDLYGQAFALGMRFGIVKADANAGFFCTWNPKGN